MLQSIVKDGELSKVFLGVHQNVFQRVRRGKTPQYINGPDLTFDWRGCRHLQTVFRQ